MGYSIPSDLNVLNAVKAKTDLLPAVPANDATVAKDSTVAKAATAALQSTTQENGGDAQSTGATVYQLVAATAAAIRRISFQGNVQEGSGGPLLVKIFILTGAAASEVTRNQCWINLKAGGSEDFKFDVQVNLPAGTRVAWKFTVSTGGASVYLGYNIEEA